MILLSHKDGTTPLDRRGWCFVFGSNLSGVHGAGAAAEAKRLWGAKWGQGFGHMINNEYHNSSFGIPTKGIYSDGLPVLSLEHISIYVSLFVDVINAFGDIKNIWLTRVGCGLSNYKNEEIAPIFFKHMQRLDADIYVSVPEPWVKYFTIKESHAVLNLDEISADTTSTKAA